jgi:hypothetical protein
MAVDGDQDRVLIVNTKLALTSFMSRLTEVIQRGGNSNSVYERFWEQELVLRT